MPRCAPGAIATCWARRRRALPRRRCASAGGRCWPSPSTRRGVKVTRCAASARPARVLVAELGLEPGPDLVALEQAILRQDPSLAAAVALPEANATCPYRGLLPYDVGDADTYYGRDDDVTIGLERLASVGALAVVGPSGGGKSSLVRAGIAATLQRRGCQVKVFSPGAHPEESFLALGIVSAGTVLVVDQCEEAFTLCDDAAERTRFLDALIEHTAHWPLVVALRADRLGDLAAHPAFARLVERSLHLLGAMDDAALRDSDRSTGSAVRAAARSGPGRRAGGRGGGRARRVAAAVPCVA